MTPTRADIIASYWLDGLSIKATAVKHGVSRHRAAELFEQYGILKRATGGRGNRDGGVATRNRMALGLMLLPSVEEWRLRRLRLRLERLAREARCHT